MLILGSELEISLDLPSLPLRQSLKCPDAGPLIPWFPFRAVLQVLFSRPYETQPHQAHMWIHPDLWALGTKEMLLKQSRLHCLAAEILQSMQAQDLAAWRLQLCQEYSTVKGEGCSEIF